MSRKLARFELGRRLPDLLQNSTVTRRRLLTSSAAAATAVVIGAVPGKSVAAKAPPRARKKSEVEQFLALIGQPFVISGGEFQGAALDLTNVSVHDERRKNEVPKGVRTEPFALQFSTENSELPRHLFATFHNDEIGDITLGVELIGAGASSRYEAVFG